MTAPTPPPSPSAGGDARHTSSTGATSRAVHHRSDSGAPTSSQPSGAGRLGRSLWLVATPLFMLLLAVLFLLSSGDLTGREAAYPQVLALLVIVLAVVSLAGDHREGMRQVTAAPPSRLDHDAADDSAGPDDVEGRRGIGLAVGRVLAFLVVAVVAVILMSYLGFFLPSALLVGGGLLVLGVRSPWKVVAYTAGVVLVAYGLFVQLLQVPFPSAPWSS